MRIKKKHDDVRSILRMNTMSLDYFRPFRGVIVIHPFLLYYDIKFDALDELRADTYIIRRTAS
jgi:hypothetical protein